MEIWELFLTFVFRSSSWSQTGQERVIHADVQGQEEEEVCSLEWFLNLLLLIFRYLGTLAKFEPFCSRPETAPIISRGDSDDIVYVSYQHKDDALRALQGIAEDEDFQELQVAPGCRNWPSPWRPCQIFLDIFCFPSSGHDWIVIFK